MAESGFDFFKIVTQGVSELVSITETLENEGVAKWWYADIMGTRTSVRRFASTLNEITITRLTGGRYKDDIEMAFRDVLGHPDEIIERAPKITDTSYRWVRKVR